MQTANTALEAGFAVGSQRLPFPQAGLVPAASRPSDLVPELTWQVAHPVVRREAQLGGHARGVRHRHANHGEQQFEGEVAESHTREVTQEVL